MDSDRQQKLVAWLDENSYEKTSLVDLSGDASFRKYYRVKKNELSYVVIFVYGNFIRVIWVI